MRGNIAIVFANHLYLTLFGARLLLQKLWNEKVRCKSEQIGII